MRSVALIGRLSGHAPSGLLSDQLGDLGEAGSVLMTLFWAETVRVKVHRLDACCARPFHVCVDAVADMHGSLRRRADLRERESEDAWIRFGDPDDRRVDHRGD